MKLMKLNREEQKHYAVNYHMMKLHFTKVC